MENKKQKISLREHSASDSVTEWFISGNLKKYDCVHAFRNLKKVDWKQSTNIHPGDIVYVYLSGKEQQIRFRCRANKTDIHTPDINDAKYNISGEYDGTYGRYMELEMLDEFNSELLSRPVMEKYGFSSPQSPVRVSPQVKEYLDIVFWLLAADELDPDGHDGSYALVRNTIDEYAKMSDLSGLDYRDLNLVYLMSVGTWRHKISAKKEAINDSHLPADAKGRLIRLLDLVWDKAERGEYSNHDSEKNSVGMFGTGFFTFKGKTDDNSPHNFIRMCIDIRNLDDDSQILSRCAQTLTDDFKGMRAASASMVLHCLKPFVFPVFNSNMGSENIFAYLGVPIRQKAEISQYIQNVRLVKSFRDKNFKIKNYRIFDMAAWKLSTEEKKMEEHIEEQPVHTMYERNIILYGPPGTGKTYNTAIYAVAICDGKPLSELTDYDAVLRRYQELKTEKRIAFTTFHQSYGYEEFVEGIRPVANEDSSELSYRVEPGIFKKFCELADAPERIKQNPDSTIWFVRLEVGSEPRNKEQCFRNGELRFDLPKYSGQEHDEWFLDRFVERMQVGDYVLSYADESINVDAVGILEGEAVCDEARENGKWSRKIRWYVLPKKVNVREINNGKYLPNFYIAKMNHMKPADLLKLIPSQNSEKCEAARPCVFIIDEINRGNISKIFGELITLIEDTKRKGMKESLSATLPYSGESFSVPQNVYILGTMNTADRSIALMDTALRRRFQFVEMLPDADVLSKIGADRVTAEGLELDVAAMLETINRRIEYLFDREHTIGHALFTGLQEDPSVEKLASIFRKSIVPLLQEYFYEDYRKIMMVLGDNGKTDDDLKFILDKEISPDSVFRGDTQDLDLPEYSYEIQEKAFYNIRSYMEIMG